uniref:Uncharacterized protein n=1 Tax=Anguilla anguilla TaxID=7936 RepID=A0A0E9X0B5_ANGAN
MLSISFIRLAVDCSVGSEHTCFLQEHSKYREPSVKEVVGTLPPEAGFEPFEEQGYFWDVFFFFLLQNSMSGSRTPTALHQHWNIQLRAF